MRQVLRTSAFRFSVSAFWMDLGTGMFIVVLPYFAMSLGADSLELGAIGAARGLAYMVACVGWAVLADRSDRRALIIAAACSIAVVLMATGLVSSLGQLYVACGLWGTTIALFWPSFFAWVGDSTRRAELGRVTGLVNLGWSVGGMVGGVLGGWLFQLARALPVVLAGVPALLACFAALTSRRQNPMPKRAPPAHAASPGGLLRLIAAWLGNASICCLLGLMGGVFPRLGTEIGVTSVVFGFLIALNGLMRSGVFLGGFLGLRWLRDWRFSVAGQLLAAAMVGPIVAVSSKLWLAAAFAAMGIAGGTNYYVSLYASLEAPGSRALKSGIHEAALLAGLLFGTFGGGALAHKWGLRAPYLPMAGVVVVLAGLQVVLQLAARRRERAALANTGSRPR